MPACAFTISPSGQNMILPVGQAAALAPRDQAVRKLRQRSEQLGDEPWLLPRPGSPTTVTSRGELEASTSSKQPRSSPSSVSRPTNVVPRVRIRIQAEGAFGASTRKARVRSACPSTRPARAPRTRTRPGRQLCALPDHDLVGRRQPSMRLAVLAMSPVTASPCPYASTGQRALHPYSRRRGHAAPARARARAPTAAGPSGSPAPGRPRARSARRTPPSLHHR